KPANFRIRIAPHVSAQYRCNQLCSQADAQYNFIGGYGCPNGFLLVHQPWVFRFIVNPHRPTYNYQGVITRYAGWGIAAIPVGSGNRPIKVRKILRHTADALKWNMLKNLDPHGGSSWVSARKKHKT